ncbi:MAG: hypothetical protein FWE07_02645 [Turicibacter sp.]|nr:hypothetical protein [Turicibacter sp.]
MEKKCSTCGAPATGRKCEYCGERIGKGEVGHHDANRVDESVGIDPNTGAPTISNGLPRNNHSSSGKAAFIAIAAVSSLLAIGAFLIFGPLFSRRLNPFNLFGNSFAEVAAADSIMIAFDGEIGMSDAMFQLDLPISGQLHIDNIGQENIGIMLEMEVSTFGMREFTTMFWRDGYRYTDLDGERSREPVDSEFEDLLAELGEWQADASANQYFFLAPADGSVEGDAERIDGGGYRLTFDFNTSDWFGDIPVFDGLFPTNHQDAVFTLTAYLDRNRNLSTIQLVLEFDIFDFGGSSGFSVDISADIAQIGNVSVDFPAWLDDVAAVEFADPTTAPFLGSWDEGFGAIPLFVFGEAASVEFLPTGDVIFIQNNGDWAIESWTICTNDILRVAGREFTWVVRGDTLILIDSWNDDWTFVRQGEGADTFMQIEDSELLGYWDNGSGRILLFVFGTADSVEFLEDGTVIITERGNSTTVNWAPIEPGRFLANNQEFSYRIVGDVLTITDSWNDDWHFDRAD